MDHGLYSFRKVWTTEYIIHVAFKKVWTTECILVFKKVYGKPI